MKSFVCFLCLLCFCKALGGVDARVITETGPTGSTNIMAIGIDSRDFEIVRFYLRGTNVLELRPDDLVQKDQRPECSNQQHSPYPEREESRYEYLDHI